MKSFLKYLLRLIALACVILVAAACWEAKVVSTLLFGEQYRAHVWIRVPQERPGPPVINATSDELSNALHLRPSEPVPADFHSDLVLKSALHHPGIADLPCFEGVENKTVWLRNQLEVKRLGTSDIFEIAIEGSDRDALCKILTAVRSAYLDRVAAPNREIDLRRYATLEKAHENTEKLIDKKKTRLKELSGQLGVPDHQSAAQLCVVAAQSLATLQTQVDQLQAQIAGCDRKIELLEGRGEALSDEEKREIDVAKMDKGVYQAQSDSYAKAVEKQTAILEKLNEAVAEMTELYEQIERMQKMYYQMGGWLEEWGGFPSALPAVTINGPVVTKIR